MAGVATDEIGTGRSFDEVSTGLALAEWRSSEQVENGSPSTSPPYWDSDDDDDDGGLKPSDLYGKYTWKIDKFSQINKRELRSNAFEVGGYKWYILIYPQGCDVCNHLSLFLCVANHDKLLPGWSHFAQFTIAVVNKDSKKSKYSDTLHRFWKKEHDWGWKKFMELSKVMDGFIDADTLIIKAQVQVIRERPDRPFRCLDCQYRRELVRVYLTNVEQICRRFVEERREKLGKLLEDKARWSSFCAFWLGMDQSSRRRMSREKTESILKVVVKHFFIEKEVTSTLVMDSLYSGLKALEGQNKGKKSKGKHSEAEDLPVPIVGIEKDAFILVDDVLLLLERAAMEPLPPKDEKGPQNRTKDGTAGEEFNRESIERDERRLTELGRRTIEIFVLAHIFSRIEVAYQEAVALKKQEELIREEEAAWLAETEQKARRGADRDKKSKKKQGKQKKNNRKAKDKVKDDKTSSAIQDKIEQDSSTAKTKEIALEPEIALEKPETVEEASDASDSVDCVPEIPLPDSDDRDVSPVNSDTASGSNAISSLSSVQNGKEGRSPSAVDDSSSTCSSDSFPSVRSVPQRGNLGYDKNKNSPIRDRNHPSKITSRSYDWTSDEPRQPSEAVQDTTITTNDASRSSNAVELLSQAAAQSLQEKVRNTNGKQATKKDEESGPLHKSLKPKHAVEVQARASSPPKNLSNGKLLVAPPKLEMKNNGPVSPLPVKKQSSNSPKQIVTSVPSTNSSENTSTLKPVPQKFATSKPADKPAGYHKHVASEKLPTTEVIEPTPQKFTTTKPTEKPSANQKPEKEMPSIPPLPVMSRPFTAPIVAGPRPAVSVVSMVQTAPILARSVSAAGRLGPETTAYGNQSNYIPQSYRNAMMGGGSIAGSSSTYSPNHSASSLVNPSHSSYSQVSSPMFSPHSPDPNPMMPTLSFGTTTLWNDRIQRDRNSLGNELQNLELNSSMQSTSGRQNHVMLDDFPHLNIINELLDDEQVVGTVGRDYQMFGGGPPHHINRQYTFPGDPAGPSCRFDRTRSYGDDGLQHGYGSSGRSYEIAPGASPSPRPYMNGQMDGFVPGQWQMGGSDPSLLRNVDGDGYPYRLSEYPPNHLGGGMNGYAMFRPSNGH